ncbi:hypothetical protein [Paraflavitalea speifideaquila]|uniref:hypothetical protein n=1 Tax=Paraflavitalea speifideaquila TaxID=3076558 RepID=UPI0028E54865|nr:hypothetical protein [Paraflavitalea speifideiaquila]
MPPVLPTPGAPVLPAGNSATSFNTTSPVNYRFTELSARNGLPSSEILSLHLDNRHLLWIGHTAGLSRYDGYAISNYLFARNKRIGRVFCFLEDTARHILWIGSVTGLFYYDNKEIIPVISGDNLPVYSLLAVPQGLWVGTGTGPAWLDTAAIRQAIHQDTVALAPRILPVWRTLGDDRRVKHMALQKNGKLLVGNFYNVYESEQESLHKIWGMSHAADLLNGIVCTDEGEVLICGNFSGVNYKKGNEWKALPIPYITGMDLHREGNNWYYYNSEAIYEVDIKSKNSDRLSLFLLITGNGALYLPRIKMAISGSLPTKVSCMLNRRYLKAISRISLRALMSFTVFIN